MIQNFIYNLNIETFITVQEMALIKAVNNTFDNNKK